VIPDVTIPGLWIEYFLIYWGVCYLVYLIVAGVVFGVRPLIFTFWQPQILFMILFLPIILPIRFWRMWREHLREERDEAKRRFNEQEKGKPGP